MIKEQQILIRSRMERWTKTCIEQDLDPLVLVAGCKDTGAEMLISSRKDKQLLEVADLMVDATNTFRAKIGLNEIDYELAEFAPALLQALQKCQQVLAKYILPDSNISDHDCLNELIGIVDNKELVRLINSIKK